MKSVSPTKVIWILSDATVDAGTGTYAVARRFSTIPDRPIIIDAGYVRAGSPMPIAPSAKTPCW